MKEESNINNCKIDYGEFWDFSKCKPKDEAINRSDPGVLMAFIDTVGIPRSGKMVHRSNGRKKVMLVDKPGREFVVPYSNVLWVKETERWPPEIIALFKSWRWV